MLDQKTALIPIADGAEDIETITASDILTRAKIQVTMASLTDKLLVKCANGTQVECNALFKDVEKKQFDIIYCPGGMGNAEATSKHQGLIQKLKDQKKSKRIYSAICATPALAFQPNGLLDGEKATCYPSLAGKLADQTMTKERVVVSNNCITSQAPGTTAECAFAIVKAVLGEEVANQIKQAMYY